MTLFEPTAGDLGVKYATFLGRWDPLKVEQYFIPKIIPSRRHRLS